MTLSRIYLAFTHNDSEDMVIGEVHLTRKGAGWRVEVNPRGRFEVTTSDEEIREVLRALLAFVELVP